MEHLTTRERELIAIGAALASNCVPCIENHIDEARKVGLTDPEIKDAVRLADELRRVPAAKVLNTALAILDDSSHTKKDYAASAGQTPKPCCGA